MESESQGDAVSEQDELAALVAVMTKLSDLSYGERERVIRAVVAFFDFDVTSGTMS